MWKGGLLVVAGVDLMRGVGGWIMMGQGGCVVKRLRGGKATDPDGQVRPETQLRRTINIHINSGIPLNRRH